MNESTPATNCLNLPEALTVQHAENIHADLLAWLHALSTESVCLDMSSVTRVDSSGYQLLLSLCKSLVARQVQYQLKGVSEDMLRLLHQFGDQTLLTVLDADNE